MSSQRLRVIVADDQPIIREGFAAVLRSAEDMDVVGCAADGVELVHLARTQTPDVAVVDVRMPGMDGITATGHISSDVAVLILTTFDLHDYVTASLTAGARGFLLKDVPAPRLIEAVRAVAAGSLLLGPSVVHQLVDDFRRSGNARSSSPKNHGLTQREGQVLTLMAEGLSNAEIAAQLVIGVETVKSHVSEILRKLGLRDRVQAVVFAYREGLVAPC